MTYQRIILILLCVILIIYVLYIGKPSDQIDSGSKRDKCTLPRHPRNGHWFISGSVQTLTPGQFVSSGTIINVQCNGQHTLDGSSLVECKNGTWKSTIGKCLELCPPVSSTSSTTVECIKNNKTENCLKPRNGTIATFLCARFYENIELNRNPFRICVNGQWNQELPVCTPICGLHPKSSSKNGLIYYPWNAAIYYKNRNSYKQSYYICAGTLINKRTILTAATCFTHYYGQKGFTNHFISAVGISSEKYNDIVDKDSQYSEIQEIFIPESFQGHPEYLFDIAVVITKTAFNITKRVQPACIDWTNKYSQVFENSTKDLSIAGPLAKNNSHHNLNNISEVPIKLINDTICYEQFITKGLYSLLKPSEKYCAAYVNLDEVRLCDLNRGVGLVAKNEYDGKYYVIGVLSSFRSMNFCNVLWTLYTKVSKYISSFITEKVNIYTPISRKYFQTSCGIKSVKAQTLIVNGKNVTKGDYPWQVAIYNIDETTKKFICGGSLLNQRVILTAAHCVTNENDGSIFPKELYAVAVGKYYRKFDDPRDTEVQFSSLREIFVPPQFKGQLQNFEGDIAILITETSFILTKQVHPICVDWDAKYESQFLKPSVSGFVAGWGFTQQNQKLSDELKELEVPYIEPSQCKSKITENYEIYFTYDKLCSGFLNEGKSVCNGDSGGGLVFKNDNDDRYYLAGIVSLAPRAPLGGCNSHQYAVYTRVSLYVKEFILEKVRLYWHYV